MLSKLQLFVLFLAFLPGTLRGGGLEQVNLSIEGMT